MDLRRIREARGWSQSHLADAAGVSLRTVQRAEAGARISGENTLALCAALDIAPMDIVPMGPPTADAFPHLGRLRDALDRALAENAGRPIWRSPDPTAALMQALDGDGLAADADGYRRASAIWESGLRRHRIRYRVANVSYDLGLFVGIVMLAGIGGFGLGYALSGPLDLKGQIVSGAILAALAVVLQLCRLSIYLTGYTVQAAAGKMPEYAPASGHGGMIPSDFSPTAAALTRDALWIATGAEGKGVSVRRLGIDILGDVAFSEDAPGTRALRVRDVRAGGGSYEVGRLGEEDLRILEGMLERRTAQEYLYAA